MEERLSFEENCCFPTASNALVWGFLVAFISEYFLNSIEYGG